MVFHDQLISRETKRWTDVDGYSLALRRLCVYVLTYVIPMLRCAHSMLPVVDLKIALVLPVGGISRILGRMHDGANRLRQYSKDGSVHVAGASVSSSRYIIPKCQYAASDSFRLLYVRV